MLCLDFLQASPFLLNATLEHHVEQYEQCDSDFTGKFLESINVDGLTSGDSEIEITLHAKRQEDLEADDLEILVARGLPLQVTLFLLVVSTGLLRLGWQMTRGSGEKHWERTSSQQEDHFIGRYRH